MRQPKDPKAFKDMDALREHLERGESGPGKMGFISGAINWVSNSSFGAQGSRQAWWTPAGLYRLLTRGQHSSCRPGMEVDLTPEDPSDPTYHLLTRQHQVLGPLLLLSRSDLRRMAQRYPPVLSMSGDEVALRVLHMREALPGCNTCLLFEQHPQLFLSGDAEQKRQQVKAAVGKLQEALKGAALGSVIMCDPHILFMDLDHGLRELRELWDVDEAAMAASEPAHLAQAVRTLCNSKKNTGLATRSS